MGGFEIDVAKSTQEVTAFLQKLVSFDTTNPPGNEIACAEWIAGVFEKEGISSTVVEPAPGRGSIVARLAGRKGGGRPILLLSHLDVVPAVAADWEHHPFAGDVADGVVWGRGTLDTKGLTALWMEIFLEIKRKGVPLERDLIFAATADEEMGGTWGVGWLVENRPELLDCEFCLNEGGGSGQILAGKTLYMCQTAEKGICWTKITAHGTAGHASTPHSDNPVVHLAEALVKIGTTRLPVHVTDTFRQFVEGAAAVLPPDVAKNMPLLFADETAESVLGTLEDKHQANIIRAMSRNTACPTVLRASDKTNVIPQTATAEVDCRILPGETPESMLAEIRRILGLTGAEGEKITAELIRTSLATESPPDTAVTRAIKKAIAKHDPEAAVVPFLVPGGTDSRFLRPKGVACYGFCPTLPGEDEASVHGKNERVTVKSLEFGFKVLWDVVGELAFSAGAGGRGPEAPAAR